MKKNSILVCVLVIFAFFWVVSDSKSDVLLGIVPGDFPMLPKLPEPNNIPFFDPSSEIHDLRAYITMGLSDPVSNEWGQHELDVFHIKSETVSECFPYNGNTVNSTWCPGWTYEEVKAKIKKPSHPVKNFKMHLDATSRWLAGRGRDDCHPYVHLLKSESRHYELGCYNDEFLFLTWETMDEKRVRTFNTQGLGPGFVWTPTKVHSEKIYYTGGSRNGSATMDMYRCNDDKGFQIEESVSGVNVALKYHGPYNIGTAEGRLLAFKELRFFGLIHNSVDPEVELEVFRIWQNRLKKVAGMGMDGPVMLMVRHDWWGGGIECNEKTGFCRADFEESYWYISIAPDSARPFGGGQVRWNVKEKDQLVRQVTAVRFVEEIAKDNRIELFCGFGK